MLARKPLREGVLEFKPRARLLKLIGEELISDEVLAVAELVKNAYDADASRVTIEFRSVGDEGGEIVVRDDGHGMHLDALLRRWMEPAGTSKSGPKGRYSPSGRRVLGEKGVGRFAADKLGATLELISRRKGEETEVRAVFDWDDFDNDSRLLSEVKNRWEVRPPIEIPLQGTVLRIGRLRARWNERMFRRLSTRLSRLRSPFQELDAFTISINSDEFPEYSGELPSDFLGRAPYRMEASFDGHDLVQMRLGESEPIALNWNGDGELLCGPVRVKVFAFDLETDSLSRVGPRMEARSWLREWSGISVYRDSFRVWPYGEPHDDWLRLDQRRVNNPVLKLSNNQVVGFVEISRDKNPDLIDQTNREGLVQNRALEDLRRLLFFVLQHLEAERHATRHPLARSRRTKEAKDANADPLADALDTLARKASPRVGKELAGIGQRLRERNAREMAARGQILDGYAELGAMGLAALGMARAIVPQLRTLRNKCEGAEARKWSRNEVSQFIHAIKEPLGLIESRLAMLSLAEGTTHRRRTLDLCSELVKFRRMMQPVLEEAGVVLEVLTPDSELIRVDMRPESLHQVLHILTTNSIEWLGGIKEPRIKVSARTFDGHCELLFADNGPGISKAMAEKVFEPRTSGKEGGSGMGLPIARSLVEQHRGTMRVLTDARRRGANTQIRLPLKRSRVTVGE